MFRFTKSYKRLLKVGGATLVVAFGIIPAWAQNNATPTNSQPQENSLLAPPTTPGQSSNVQGNNQAAVLTQPANNGQPSKDVFMQPNQAQADQNMQQYQVNRPQTPAPPQPPQRNDQSSNINQSSNQRPQLGVYVVPTNGAGVRINSITSGTAADAAGLKPGDIVLGMNGRTVATPDDVINGIQQMRVGDQVELRIWRNGQEQNISATLQPMREAPIAVESVPSGSYIEGGVVPNMTNSYSTGPVRRYYSSPGRYYSNYGGYYGNGYYGNNFYGNGYYGRGYGGSYIGTPGLGYYRSPWGGQGVRVGSFGFGWR